VDLPAIKSLIFVISQSSLKTHRKKQLREDKGILNHMKISALKRAEGFHKPDKTFFEIFSLIKLVTT